MHSSPSPLTPFTRCHTPGQKNKGILATGRVFASGFIMRCTLKMSSVNISLMVCWTVITRSMSPRGQRGLRNVSTWFGVFHANFHSTVIICNFFSEWQGRIPHLWWKPFKDIHGARGFPFDFLPASGSRRVPVRWNDMNGTQTSFQRAPKRMIF